MKALIPTPATGHSPIGASSYYRWGTCPGSVRECKGIKSESSPYALEGTLAHSMAEKKLKTGRYPETIAQEMQENVDIYVNYIKETMESGDELLIEQGFDLGQIYPELWGTADAVIWKPKTATLIVIDLKYGAGIPVEVQKQGKPNEQLAYYALGALLQTKYPAQIVEMVVVQPRCFHSLGPVRSFRMDAIDLLDFADDLAKAARRTSESDAPLIPGDHCRFCPAAGKCPAIASKATKLAKMQFQPIHLEKEKAAQLPELLPWLPVLEAWIENVRAFAYREAKQGRMPPGYKLVAKRGMRKWKDESEIIRFFEMNFRLGREIYEPGKLKSVAQMEKIVHKNQHDSLLPFIETVSSGDKLVAESEPGEALNPLLEAQRQFTATPYGSELFD